MKKARLIGAAALVLAVLVAVLGVISMNTQPGEGALGEVLGEAQQMQAIVNGNAKAVKNITSADKKVENAQKAVSTAATETEAAVAAVAELRTMVDNRQTGNEELDHLLHAAAPDVEPAEDVLDVIDSMVLKLFSEAIAPAQEAVAKAEENINTALEGAAGIYEAMGADATVPQAVVVTEPIAFATMEEAAAAADAYAQRAAELETLVDEAAAATASADAAAREANATVKMSFAQRIVLALKANRIAILFTAGLLAVIGVALLFFAKPLLTLWKKNSVFPVFVVLLAMLVFQTYALGFDQPSVGEWLNFWINNNFNVLRANTSIGIIALGMTLVIITGGIDLAVGSTVAGVGTVMMVLMDTSSAGILYNMGVTGLPLYIIGVAGGIVTGVLLGLLTGLAITKGGVPPFIVTLGTMNIVRSVAQYFTQSYNPKIPEGFSNMANTVIGGQRILPILYWLVLVVIVYVISRHTAFGRHVYAVGSNERTTKLSGINVHKVKIKVYMLMGLLVSIAAAVQLSRLGGMDVASAGSGYEMDAIAAVVVGGTSMAGGKGSIVGTVLGVLIIGMMNNLLILLGVDSFLTNAFKGAIVLLAVLMQRKEKTA